MIFKFRFLVKNLLVPPETTIVMKFFFLKLVSDDLKWSEMPKKYVKYKFCSHLRTHLRIHLRTHFRIHLRMHLRIHLRTHQKSKFKNHVFKAFQTILSHLRPTFKTKFLPRSLFRVGLVNFSPKMKIYKSCFLRISDHFKSSETNFWKKNFTTIHIPPETTIVVEIFFQKLVSDYLKWSEMPKKHDS